jgi:hypothetical protein
LPWSIGRDVQCHLWIRKLRLAKQVQVFRKTLDGKVEIPTTFSTGPDIQKLALKMSVALSRLVPTFDLEEVSSIRDVLYSGNMASRPVETAFDDYPLLDEYRPDLAHTIYIERGEKETYGVVQFFGVFQFYCRLGESAEHQPRSAFLGTLDPLTGAECFSDVQPLNLAQPPSHRWTRDIPELISHWEEKFRGAAIKRGARSDAEKHKMTGITLNPKSPTTWESGTVDFLLRLRDREKT